MNSLLFKCRPLLCLSVVAALFFSCAQISLEGGSGSTTTNGLVTGMVVLPGGGPAARTQVKLLPAGYDLVKDTAAVKADTTDPMGNYSFSHVYPGDFTIHAVQLDDRTRALVSGIHVANDTVAAPAGTLHAPGTIRVYLPGGVNGITGYVYVPGTTCLVFLNNHNDFVILDSVPAGVIPAVSYSAISITTSSVIRYDVPMVPGDTTVIYNPAWKYARRLFLNTTTGGANVSGDVFNFPVLVRLSAQNFTFAQAKADGGDLRFTRNNGTPLPYELERYDAGSHRAEIWVKTDTVYGSDSSHFITMYWGNPNAADSSNGPAVFDTMNGFQGTWHLGGTDSLALDATGNRYNGTGYFTASVAGIIGNAYHFNGLSSYIRMKGTAPQSRLNFPMNGRYTVSAWVYHDTLADSVTYLIAGKSELQYFIKSFDRGLSTAQHEHQWEFTEYHGNDIWQAATFVPAARKMWTYLVGIRDGSDQYLYVNGALAMQGYQVVGTGQSTVPRDTTDDFTIGAFLHPVSAWNQGYAWFNGTIDEVDVSSAARSADWIKLSYMNQQEPDALVKW
jgi:hypothetical protein